MKKVAIVYNPEKPAALELLPTLRDWLVKRDCEVLESSCKQPAERVLKDVELVICMGGDGTLLSIASKLKECPAPVIGINMGRVGFLTEVKNEEIFEELKTFFLGHSEIEERLMLASSARSEKHKKERRFTALNDIVISREGLSRILHLEIYVSDEKLTSFSGDGVIIASPTGSTAYSLSAGGAVVHPKLEAMIITPICPHTSSLRPIVVSAEEKIMVKIDSPRGSGKALLTADGQENLEIDDSYIVEIMRASTPVKLVKSSRRSYFATLRENFKFPS